MFRRFCILAAVVGAASVARAADFVIVHHGRLLQANDAPVTGTVKLTVRLYKSATGGSSDIVWTEQYDVTPLGGAYAIALGDTRNDKKPLTPADVTGERWMSVVIEGTELTPRQVISAVPQALDARSLGGRAASEYALKTDVSPDAQSLGGRPATAYALKTDTAPDADKLGGKSASEYALKGQLSTDAATLGGRAAADFALKIDTAPNALQLGGKAAVEYALKTDTAPNTLLFGGEPPSAFVKTSGGGDFSITGTGTFGGVGLTQRSAALPACNASAVGQLFFSATAKDFFGCDGTAWLSLTGKLTGTSASRPGTSCNDIRQKSPQLGDGIYWVDFDGVGVGEAPFRVICDMTRDGGGWTLGLKNWYQSGAHGVTARLANVEDGYSRRERPFKLSDIQIRGIIGADRNFDVLVDQHGHNSAYSSGNHEYVILRNYTADFSFNSLVPESSTVTQMQSYRASDNALAWTGRLACGTPVASSGVDGRGVGINCNNVVTGPNPSGGAGCNINMGSSVSTGWHYFYMSEYNTDTYVYICNGAQHSSSHDMVHRWWFR